MKTLLAITIALLFYLPDTYAQSKHSAFADVNISNKGYGASLIYSYKLIGSFCVGAGAQGIYDNSYNMPRTALFGDFRFQWPVGHGMLFFHLDAGTALHNSYFDPYLATTVPSVTLYTALGLGYTHIINKRGMGPYASFRVGAEGFSYSQFDYYAQQQYKIFTMDAMPTVAIGFKF